MAASECGSTTLLLPSRHQPKLQPHAPRAPAVSTVSTVASSAVAVRECDSGSLAHAAIQGMRAHRTNCRHHPDKLYLRDKEGDMRERNLLLAAPTLQGLRKQGDTKYQEVPDDDESELETLAGDDEEAGRNGRTGSMWPQVSVEGMPRRRRAVRHGAAERRPR